MPGAMSGHPFLYDIYIMNRILIIILLLTCTVSHAQPPETVQHLGSTITTYGRKIISDKGSIWLTGEFNGELITDTQTDLTSALPTVFVARYSVEGIREHLSMIENESQVRSAVTDENGTLWLLTGTDGNEKLYSISPKGVLSAPMSFAEHMDLILKDFVLLDHTLYLCGNSEEQYFLAAYSMSGEQLWKISERICICFGRKDSDRWNGYYSCRNMQGNNDRRYKPICEPFQHIRKEIMDLPDNRDRKRIPIRHGMHE